MRIAMVSVHANPLDLRTGAPSAGQHVQVGELSARLAREGHEVSVYTRRTDPGQPERLRTEEGYDVVQVSAGPVRPVSQHEVGPYLGDFAAALRRAWRAHSPQVVHAHYWYSGLAAALAARGTTLPVVQTFHSLGAVKRRHQGSRDTSPGERIGVEAMLGKRAAAVVASGGDELGELARLGVPRKRITIVPPGVDTDLFRDSGPVTPRTDRRRLLAVGRLVPDRGFDTAIAAMAGLPDTELLIAGAPTTPDLRTDPEARRLRQFARTCGAAERVRLLGHIDRAAMPALLRSADVLVCTPGYEPFGLVPVEAMACGVPVVATEVGGLTDAVVDGVTGLHVPPHQPRAVQRALRLVLGNSGLRAALGSAAWDRAQSRFAWSTVATEILRVYERLNPGPEPGQTATTGATMLSAAASPR